MAWQQFELAPANAASNSSKTTSVSRIHNSMEVWWIGANGSIQDAYWYEGGQWGRFELAPASSAAPNGGITAVSRIPGSMEVWWIGENGSVQGAFWYEGGQWGRYELAPAGSASINGGIKAVSRIPGSMEVWWIGADGSIQDAFWYEGGQWGRFELAPAGSASTNGGITAVSRIPNSMEVWWAGANGSVQDAFWYDQPAPPPSPSGILHIHDDITFRSGVAVGGSFDLSLTRQGDISFSGHLHDSGLDSYDMTLVVVLMTPDGLAYSVTHQGRTHGPFDPGSRDDDWVINQHNELIAAQWDGEFSRANWRWSSHAGSLIEQDLTNFIADIAKELASSLGKAAVAAVVALI